ncbi:hypothetical protein CW362_04975 [Streptomyces populi]|uniref:Bacterial Ig-like domain-containing protein n=1 Tax=Streptomyces populi TaxID=2058924 RepID=A0A2I0SVR0_9ACTN|nr:hypothetical protein [Streptomyces populi]PKT74016.1 hypothetical protein CW362_04975 [Streptomyces populi]
MSESAAKGRQVIRGIDASGAHPVEYRFAHARGGNRHLTVVFADTHGPDDHGWATGMFDDLRSNILWIRDRFDDGNTYYLCKEGDFGIEESVIGLIQKVVKALGLTPADVTLWGSSKGGSAALHFGLKYGFRNIVASVPQLRIGTFVRDVHPDTGRHMLGETMPEDRVRLLDSVLTDLLVSEVNPGAHLYLVSSPQDEQYATQIEPYLGLLQRYPNFNFLFSESPHITGHDEVTRRNTPPLLGIAHLLVEGISPRLGVTRHGHEEPDADRSGITGFLASTSIVQDRLAPPVVTMPLPHDPLPVTGVPLTGRAPGAVRVSIWENGGYLASAPVGPEGDWTWRREEPWSTGEHTVRLFAVDRNGIQSARTDVTFTASDRITVPRAPDATEPEQRFDTEQYFDTEGARVVLLPPLPHTPEPGQQLLATSIRFTGASNAATRVGFRENGVLLGSCPVAHGGRWLWDAVRDWSAGTHTVEVVAANDAGEVSPPATVTFAVIPVPGQ